MLFLRLPDGFPPSAVVLAYMLRTFIQIDCYDTKKKRKPYAMLPILQFPSRKFPCVSGSRMFGRALRLSSDCNGTEYDAL